MESKLKVQAILDNKIERRFETNEILNSKIDGLKLDEIQMSVNIRTKRDVDELINFLKISRECLS